MRVAVLQCYERGEPLGPGVIEKWGVLKIEHFGQKGSLVATLKQEANMQEGLLPPLFNVSHVKIWSDMMSFNGFERVGKAWHLQTWRCRLVTSQEFHVAALRSGCVDVAPAIATYRHWWSVIDQARRKPEPRSVIDIAEVIDLLEIEQVHVWGFLEWVSATKRGYKGGAGQGRDGLGELTFTNRTPVDGIPRDPRYGEIPSSIPASNPSP